MRHFGEIESLVEFRKREFRFDLRQGNHPFQACMFLRGKPALSLPTMDKDIRTLRLGHHQDFQAWNRQIGIALLSQISSAGRFANHLQHNGRALLKPLVSGIGTTNDLGIGTVEPGLVSEFDTDLCIAGKGTTGFPPQGRDPDPDRIRGNGSMVIRAPAMA